MKQGIKLVSQENRSSGCGPACIAMVANLRSSPSKTAYQKAVELMFGPDRDRNLYTHWHHLRAALDHLRVDYADSIHRHRSWEAITTLSIVKCGQFGDQGQFWHWVVYDGRSGILYDPLRDSPVRPDGRTRKPRSHLPIFR